MIEDDEITLGETTDLRGESQVESYVKVAGDDAERPAREEEE